MTIDPKLREAIKKMLALPNVHVGPPKGEPMPEDAMFVVSAVEDFDPETNILWGVAANKSYPRDLFCGSCKRQVVMSDGLYERYLEVNKPEQVICAVCLMSNLKVASDNGEI